MPPGRRNSDRRRRVLYQSHASPNESSTAASRRAALKLREARQPARTFGTRVHRRLRARWFSIVPVRRRSLTIIVSVLIAASLLLVIAHHAAVSWPAIANRGEIARALRLDRADSLGRWLLCISLLLAAGCSFLIYQLRRYRNDDYRGHYRLWRLMLVVLVLASINAQVGLVRWSGAVIDALVGKRVAMAGGDWLRIMLGIGGTILAMRMIAEVNRCRGALVFMIAAVCFLAIPEAAHWHFFEVNSLGKSTLVIAAPLLGYTCFLIASITYLRRLYRQAKNIPDEPILEKIKSIQLSVFSPYEENNAKELESSDEKPKRRGWFRRRNRDNDKSPEEVAETEEEIEEYEEAEEEEYEEEYEDEALEDEEPEKPKRRWFGLRRAKPQPDEDDEDVPETVEPEPAGEAEEEKPAKRKGWFSGLRMRPQRLVDAAEDEDEPKPESTSDGSADTESSDDGEKPKRGLAGWLKRKKSAGETEESEESVGDTAPKPQQRSQKPAAKSNQQSSTQTIDPDDIDWSSMSKSERRRLRKKLKREGKVA